MEDWSEWTDYLLAAAYSAASANWIVGSTSFNKSPFFFSRGTKSCPECNSSITLDSKRFYSTMRSSCCDNISVSKSTVCNYLSRKFSSENSSLHTSEKLLRSPVSSHGKVRNGGSLTRTSRNNRVNTYGTFTTKYFINLAFPLGPGMLLITF